MSELPPTEGSQATPISTGPPRLTPLRERQLVDAHRDGDPEALSELLQGYQRRVYSICYRMLRNADDASDLTQDALIKVLENLDAYDGRAQLSTWIIRITINCCLSHLRKKKVRRHASLEQSMLSGDASRAVGGAAREGELSAPQRIEREEMHSTIHRAMMDLEPDARALLVLRDMQGLEYEQLAQALDVPVGTVKSRLFRARAAFRAAMDHLQH